MFLFRKKLKFKLTFYVLLFIISGCAHQKKGSLAKKKGKDFYTVRVDGVECAMCAKKAVVALESAPSIVHAEYVCNDSEYIDCYARVYGKGKRKNVLIAEIGRAHV